MTATCIRRKYLFTYLGLFANLDKFTQTMITLHAQQLINNPTQQWIFTN